MDSVILTKMKKRTVEWLVVGTGIIFILPYLIFFCHFGRYNQSDESSDWSNFGEFIGGVSGSVLSLFSLWAFIYLTYKISRWDDKRSEKQIETEKKILLCELRNEFIKDVNLIFTPFYENLFLKRSFDDDSYLGYMTLQFHTKVSNSEPYLFPNITEHETYKSLTDEIERFEKLQPLTKQKPEVIEDAIAGLIMKKESFVSHLQKMMYRDLRK